MKDKGMKDKIKGFFGGEVQEEVTGDDDYYTISKEEYHEQNGMAGSKMMLLEPRAYSESQQIADYCNANGITKEQLQNIVSMINKR